VLGRLGILLALLAAAVAPATAVAAPRDVASTHAYIAANYAFLQAARAGEHTVNANVAKLNQRFGAQCPKVGAGSPQNEEAQKMSYEVAGALWSTLYHTDAPAVRRFARAVESLRWSNPKLTRIAHTYITSLRELTALQVPDLCGDVRAWAADGFKTVPASTASYDRHVEAIEGKSIPPRLLAPYEQPGERTLAARATHLEVLLEHSETVVGFNDWDTLLETLGLNQ
jgi:hypothetical protein